MLTLSECKINMTNKTCLITGIGGFVGNYLAASLYTKGFSVFGFDRQGKKVPHAITEAIDLLNKDAVHAFVEKVKPNYVFHLAAQSSVYHGFKDEGSTQKIAVEGTRNLLDALLTVNPACNLLVASSAEIYGKTGNSRKLLTETDSFQPITPYGQSRLAQDALLASYSGNHDLRVVVARSFPHTGPGQTANFACSSFARQIALIEAGKQDSVLQVGNLEAVRDYVDVRDVVEAYYQLLINLKCKGIYNVCSGKGVSLASALQILLKLSEKEITIKQDPKRMRPADISYLAGDRSKLTEDTQWEPKISLEETLSALLNYWREQVKLAS